MRIEPVKIEIRPYQDGDTNGIRDLILPIQNDEFSLPITFEEQPDLAAIPEYYQTGRGDFWVAIADEQVMGTISLVELAEDNSALRKMFVAADYRGSVHGVANKLLTTLIDHARAEDLKRICLGTTDAFKAAHRFYEKHGFDRIEPADLPTDFSYMKVDTRFYVLALG